MRRLGSLAMVLWAATSSLTACSDGGSTVAKEDGPSWTGATALTGQEDHATGIATDGTVAVFSTGGSQVGENAVRSVPLDGSAGSAILQQEPGGDIPSDALAISDGDVFVATSRSIVRFPLAGGAVTTIVTDRPGTISSLAVDDGYVWWTTGELNQPDRAELARAPKGGGTVEVLGDPDTGHGSYTSVVLDGDGGAYAASPGGIVHARPGQSPTVVVTDDQASGAVTRIAFDGDRLYGIVAGGRNDLFAVPKDGGDLTQLARHADSVKSVVATPKGIAYFDGEALRLVPATGGESMVLASGKYADGALALAGDQLVFPADWTIWTVPLPA